MDTPKHHAGRRHWSGRRPRSFIASEALTRVGECLSAASTAAKYRQYSNKSEHLSFSSNGRPSRRSASLGRRGRRLKSCHPDQSSRRSSPKERARRSTRRGSPRPALRFARRHRAGVRIDLQRHRHVCGAPDPHDHPLVDIHVHQQRCASPPRVVNRRHVVDPVNTRWTAHSGEVGSRLLAAVRAEMTSSNGGTPDSPAGVA